MTGPSKRIETQMEQRLRSTIKQDERDEPSNMRIEGSASSVLNKADFDSQLKSNNPSLDKQLSKD